MASEDRNPQYEEYEAEFNTLREEMDALGIGASFKPLMAYEYWSRCRPSKRKSIVGNARRDNELAIDRAKKAAAAAAAVSEAGNSQAGPSVRGRSNTRSPLAILTTRWIAQRAGSLAGIARWWGVARATASSLMAAVMQVLPSSSPAHILAKLRLGRLVGLGRDALRRRRVSEGRAQPGRPDRPRPADRACSRAPALVCVSVGARRVSRIARACRAPCVWD
jgi:hypothetical protein